MAEPFREILGLQGVRGVVLVSTAGEVLAERWNQAGPPAQAAPEGLGALPRILAESQEVDLIFSGGRLYARAAPEGILLVLLGLQAPVALVRLQVEQTLPLLKKRSGRKGFLGLFNLA